MIPDTFLVRVARDALSRKFGKINSKRIKSENVASRSKFVSGLKIRACVCQVLLSGTTIIDADTD